MSKNSYERAARKKSLLAEITQGLETEGNLRNTGIETLKDVVIGVVAGGVAGSAIGRFSLVVGAAVTGLGHYYKHRLASIFGVGMMAANGFQQTTTQIKGTPKEGLEGTLEGAKERVMNFKDTFGQKLFLDKVFKSKKEEQTAKGVGETQYFTYSENPAISGREGEQTQLDLTALDRLEQQVAKSGDDFSKKLSGTGMLPADDMGEIDPADKNF